MIEISWKEGQRLIALGGHQITDIHGGNYILFQEEVWVVSPQPKDNPEYEQSLNK